MNELTNYTIHNQIEDWLDEYGITNYTIHEDLVIDVHEKVYLLSKRLASLPFQFGIIQGDFNCTWNQLTSLKHCPKEVHGDFFCYKNKLTSLEHCPKVIKGFFVCDHYLRNDIRNLRHHLAKLLQKL